MKKSMSPPKLRQASPMCTSSLVSSPMTCTPRSLPLGASKIILIIPSVSPMIWPRPWLPYLSLPTTEQAGVAVCHTFGFEYKKETDRFRPTYLFSIPEAAWVGLNGGAGPQISIHLCEASTDDLRDVSD